MTNGEYPQGRKSRLLDVDRCIRERDGFGPSSLGLCLDRAETIKREGRKEIVDSERFATVSQMKVDGVRRRSAQVTLSDLGQ